MVLSDPGLLGTSLVAELEQSPAIDVQWYDDRNDMYRDIRMGLLAGGRRAAVAKPCRSMLQQASTGAGVVVSTVNSAAAQISTRATAVDALRTEVSVRRPAPLWTGAIDRRPCG